ncbi:MAG: cellulose biosynthesis cyclic di-GMP-binding regulatory protein BcsB [Myxococcota bacterium]
MPGDRSLAIALLFAPSLAFAQEAPAEAPPEVATPEVSRPEPRVFTGRFSDALQLRTDQLLEGVDARADLVFPLPGAWELVEDPRLVVDFEHSSALIPERSHLTVTVNDHPVGSVALDEDNGLRGRLELRVPRDALQPYNHLEIRAVQHVAHHCEDPFDPSLWTRVRKDSFVEMKYVRKPVTSDLGAFPWPLFDETGYGPAEFAVLSADAPSPEAIEAAGRFGLAMGRIAGYRRVRVAPPVRSLEEARTHVLVVGTLDQVPAARELVGDVSLKPGQGLVALVPNPTDPTLAVLVVTGADAEGVARAATAITSRDRYPALTGDLTRVEEATAGAAPAWRGVPRPAPAKETFALSELGLADQTVRGFHGAPVRVPLGLEGDAVVRPDGGRATLRYAYGAGLDPQLSSLEVRIDGVTVRSVPLSDPKGEARAEVELELPETLLAPDAVLEVGFHLFPADFDACRYLSDRTIWGTLYAESELTLARDHVADLPDLDRLAFRAWPFTLEPGGGEVLALLPDRVDATDLAAGVQLAAELGRISTADMPAFRLASAADVSLERGTHYVVLDDGTPHRLRGELEARGVLQLGGTTESRLVDEARRLLLGASVGEARGTIEEALHPSDPGRAVLVLAAHDAAGLTDVIDAIADPARVHALEGNVAVVADDGAVRTLKTARPRQVGSYAVGAQVQLAMRRNWAFVGLGLVGAAFLLTAVKRAWAKRREGP